MEHQHPASAVRQNYKWTVRQGVSLSTNQCAYRYIISLQIWNCCRLGGGWPHRLENTPSDFLSLLQKQRWSSPLKEDAQQHHRAALNLSLAARKQLKEFNGTANGENSQRLETGIYEQSVYWDWGVRFECFSAEDNYLYTSQTTSNGVSTQS